MTTKIRLLLVAALLTVAASLWPLMASGQQRPSRDQITEAKRLFKAGARAYDAGRFGIAAQAFDQAYELAPRPPLRFSAAQALRRHYARKHDPALLRKAQSYFQKYIDEVKQGGRVRDATEALGEIEVLLTKHTPAMPIGEGGAGGGAAVAPSPPAATSNLGTLQIDSEVEGAIATVAGRPPISEFPGFLDLAPGNYQVTVAAPGHIGVTRSARVYANRPTFVAPRLQEMPAVLMIHAGDGADVIVDGRPVGQTPLGRPLELRSGTHHVVVGRNGHDLFAEEIELGRGEKREVVADIGMTTQRYISWTVFGGATLSTGAGIILAILAASQQRSAQDIKKLADKDERALTSTEANDFNSAVSSRNNLLRFATGSFVLGGIGAGVGLLLYLLDEPKLYAASAAAARANQAAEQDSKDDADEPKEPSLELDAKLVPLFGPGVAGVSDNGGMLLLEGRF